MVAAAFGSMPRTMASPYGGAAATQVPSVEPSLSGGVWGISQTQAQAPPALRKSLRELGVASSALGSGAAPSTAATLNTHSLSGWAAPIPTAATSDYAAEASAHKLLARNGFDSAHLGRSARELEARLLVPSAHGVHSTSAAMATVSYDDDEDVERRTRQTLLPPHSGGTVQEVLRNHQNALVQRTLRQSHQATRRAASQLVDARIAQDLQAEREFLMRDLAGYRYATSGTQPQSTATSTRTSALGLPTSSFAGSSLSSEWPQRHASLVASLNRNPQDWTPEVLLSELEQLAERLAGDASASASGSATAGPAYGTACLLLKRSLLGSTADGHFTNEDVVKQRTTGSLLHLCLQFRSHIMARVRAATLAGRTPPQAATSLTGLAMDVAFFVHMQLGTITNTSHSLWAQLFYCLRCGDASAALQTIRNAPRSDQNDIDPAIVQLISALADLGGDSLFSQTQTFANPLNRQDVADLYHRTKMRGSTGNNNGNDTSLSFQLACLALLSLEEPLATAAPYVVNTIEDYLFGALWVAVQSPTECAQQVAKLGQLIQHWGPAHFEGEESTSSGGWAYAMPCLISQQYASALRHLAESSSLLQATHLAIAMDRGATGALLRDWTTTTTTTATTENVESASCDLLTEILVTYASQYFQTTNPSVALEYLIRIPDSTHQHCPSSYIGSSAKKQIRRLIVESCAFEVLGGTMDGSWDETNAGALHSHFSPAEVSTILADAAGDTLREGNTADAAELYALGGRYSSLLSLLNHELATCLVEDTEKRRFWRNAALQFHSIHLTQGRTHVIDALEKEGTLSLGNTFQLILNLMVFFDRCRNQEWEDAWSLVDDLQLLPRSESDRSLKVESFQSLDSVIQKSFHQVLLGAMESLSHQHTSLKGRHVSSPIDANAVSQRLKELRERARLLVTFASLLPLGHFAGDTVSRIAQMEAYMM
eukprot:scaffold19138_cov53-Attheya_sp.AAC.1